MIFVTITENFKTRAILKTTIFAVYNDFIKIGSNVYAYEHGWIATWRLCYVQCHIANVRAIKQSSNNASSEHAVGTVVCLSLKHMVAELPFYKEYLLPFAHFTNID